MVKKAIVWLFESFTNTKDGSSARKLSAFFAIVIMAAFVTIHFTTPANAENMVIIWLVFASLCLSLVTVQQVIELKNGKKDDTNKTAD